MNLLAFRIKYVGIVHCRPSESLHAAAIQGDKEKQGASVSKLLESLKIVSSVTVSQRAAHRL